MSSSDDLSDGEVLSDDLESVNMSPSKLFTETSNQTSGLSSKLNQKEDQLRTSGCPSAPKEVQVCVRSSDEEAEEADDDDQSDVTEMGDCDDVIGGKPDETEGTDKSSSSKCPFSSSNTRGDVNGSRKRGVDAAVNELGTPAKKSNSADSASKEIPSCSRKSDEKDDLVSIEGKGSKESESPSGLNQSSSNHMCTSLELPKPSYQLPQGWKSILHDTGLPMYYHKQSGVATFSRPFLVEKKEAIRSKEPPLSSIPCLEYRYYLKNKKTLSDNPDTSVADAQTSFSEKDDTIGDSLETSVASGTGEMETDGGPLDSPEKSLCQESKSNGSSVHPRVAVMKNVPSQISGKEMLEYVEKLFVVKERKLLSAVRAKKQAMRKARGEAVSKKNDRGVLLLIRNGDKYENIRIMEANHTTRTYITVLNDYCFKALKATPVYNCSNVLAPTNNPDSENPAQESSSITTSSAVNPSNASSQSHCVVSLLNVKYGEAIAVGKRSAKNLAAKEALKILCPEVLHQEGKEAESEDPLISSLSYKLRLVEVFKSFKIGDVKIVDELKLREATNFAPLQLLNQFLVRNLSPAELKLHTNFVNVQDPKTGAKCHECELKLGSKYSAKAIAKTQNHAAQYAALKLLQELHPTLIHYSSLIRLYGIDPSEIQMQKERQIREEVAQSQDSAACDTILKLLREEMKKAAAASDPNTKTKDTFDVLKITPEEPEYFYTKLWHLDKN